MALNDTEQLDGVEQDTESLQPEEASESGTTENITAEENKAAEENTAADSESPELNEVQPPKKKKYGWVGYVLLLAVIALGIFMMFQIVAEMGHEVKALDEVIAASDWRFALVSVAVILAIFVCLGFEYVIVLKATTGKFHFRAGIKTAFIGKFYDHVTPFASGGQPMQIYYLNKKGFHGGVSSAIVLIRYFAWMFCFVGLSLVFMSVFTGVLQGQEQSSRLILTIGGWIGLVVNMFLPLLLILFVVLPKFSYGLASGVIKIGCKFKIVKNKDKAMEKVTKIVDDFRSSFAIMSRSPLKFIILILLCLIEIFLTFAFPYFVMKMFSGLTDADGIHVMFTVMALNIYATMSASVVPTPGNSGAIEGIVTAAFSALAGSVLLWTVFVWRFGVYYIYIIIGLVVTVFDFIRKLVRSRKSRKTENI